MALWGKYDSKTASGTIAITTGGAVTGSGTSFTTQAKVGNTIRAGGADYEITFITDDTHVTVRSGINGGAMAAVNAGASYALSEKPAYVAASESGGNSNLVYGVDTAEMIQGSNDVVEVGVVVKGTGYTEVPAVTFATGSQTATAAIAGGSVTGITITGSGAYDSVPAVTVAKARRTVATSAVSTSTDTITYTGHGMNDGEALKYVKVGTTAIAGLTTDATYYAHVTGADTFKLYDTQAHALAAGATGLMDLTGTGNNAQYFELSGSTQATARAALGSGPGGTHVTHAGWVRRTVGTGNRAGRIQYETLVAMSSGSGDAADDVVFPDN